MKKIWLYIKQKYICLHDYEDIKNSKWYFHYRCRKCGFERGMGNFKIKD